ncbi:hypothetical protein Tco_0730831 [Tanacetum coccineum]
MVQKPRSKRTRFGGDGVTVEFDRGGYGGEVAGRVAVAAGEDDDDDDDGVMVMMKVVEQRWWRLCGDDDGGGVSAGRRGDDDVGDEVAALVMEMWCGSGGGWLESGRKKVTAPENG